MLPNIRNILFAAGLGQDTEYVLTYALSQAQKYAARIHVVHSHEALNITDQGQAEIYMQQEGMLDDFEKSPLDTAEKVSARLEEICRQVVEKNDVPADVIANIRISEHAPKAAILSAADEFEADLIIMGSHRHTVVADALLGSTTMKILHSANVPVLVVRIPEGLSESKYS